MIPGLSLGLEAFCMVESSLPRFPLWTNVSHTISLIDVRKNQVTYKCGNNSLGLCHVIKMCCVWDSCGERCCVSNNGLCNLKDPWELSEGATGTPPTP